MNAGDVRNSRLISCTWTQYLQLDSGRQQQFSSLSSEAAASNAHYSQPSVEVGMRWDFRKPALSTGHCKLNAMSWSYTYLYATFLRLCVGLLLLFHIFSIISRGTIGARGNLGCWGGGGDRTRNIKIPLVGSEYHIADFVLHYVPGSRWIISQLVSDEITETSAFVVCGGGCRCWRRQYCECLV